MPHSMFGGHFNLLSFLKEEYLSKKFILHIFLLYTLILYSSTRGLAQLETAVYNFQKFSSINFLKRS